MCLDRLFLISWLPLDDIPAATCLRGIEHIRAGVDINGVWILVQHRVSGRMVSWPADGNVVEQLSSSEVLVASLKEGQVPILPLS